MNLDYSLYIFDARSEEVVFDYRKDFPGISFIAFMNDLELKENPAYKDKVRNFEKGFGRWETLYFVNELPENVISNKLMNYIKYGITVHHKGWGEMKWAGLAEIIPEK